MTGALARERFCFVHASDLHLDTPFEGFAQVPSELRDALRDASLEAFDALIDLTIERDAAFLVVAGDVYDGAERGVRAQIRFRDGLARLAERGIPSFVVHGNHDPVGEGWCAIGSWPDGVTVFGAEGGEPQTVPVERDGAPIAQVQGVSFARRDEPENLARRFRRAPGPGLQVGVLHCNVEGAGGHANYAPCTRADLAAVGLDYWALGHVHTRTVLLRDDGADGSGAGADGCWAVYCGNLQGRSARPAEAGPKGAVVVDVEGTRVRRVEPVALDRVRFAHLEASVEGCSDLAELVTRLEEEAERARARAEGRALVVRARIVGRSPLRGELGRDGALDGLCAALRDVASGLRPLLWWDRIDDASRFELDREALRKVGDFRSALIEESNRLAEAPEALSALLGELPERVSGLVLEEVLAGSCEPPGANAEGDAARARAEWLADAERDALDALEQVDVRVRS